MFISDTILDEPMPSLPNTIVVYNVGSLLIESLLSKSKVEILLF